MAEAEAVAAPAIAAGMTADQRHWLLRRLHSLSGIIPIGGFLFFHLFENAFVLKGGGMWWKETEFTRSTSISDRGRSVGAVDSDSLPRDLRPGHHGHRAAQRLPVRAQLPVHACSASPGILAFLFIGFHVLTTRAYFYATGVETNYLRMHNFMMNPLILTIYIVGTLACVYHLTNGIFTFTITWGIAVGAKAQTLVNRACVALFVVLAIVSVSILIAFRAPA